MLRYDERYINARSNAYVESRCLVLEKSDSGERSDTLMLKAVIVLNAEA